MAEEVAAARAARVAVGVGVLKKEGMLWREAVIRAAKKGSVVGDASSMPGGGGSMSTSSSSLYLRSMEESRSSRLVSGCWSRL